MNATRSKGEPLTTHLGISLSCAGPVRGEIRFALLLAFFLSLQQAAISSAGATAVDEPTPAAVATAVAGPSLDRTMQWIRSSLPTMGVLWEVYGDGPTTESYRFSQDASVDGCDLKIAASRSVDFHRDDLPLRADGTPYPDTRQNLVDRVAIPLDALDSSHLKIYKLSSARVGELDDDHHFARDPEVSFIEIRVLADAGESLVDTVLDNTYPDTLPSVPPVTFRLQAYHIGPLVNAQSARRLVNALKRAADLCRASAPF